MASFKKFYLNEFEEDIGKKTVVLMGLPAAGKTTFIKSGLKKVFPDFKNFKTANSDQIVLSLQFDTAKQHFTFLKSKVKNEKDFSKFIEDTKYKNNDGKTAKLNLTFKKWKELEKGGIKKYWAELSNPFYRSYFDIRDFARKIEADLFKEKITKAGDFLIIDTTAPNSYKLN